MSAVTSPPVITVDFGPGFLDQQSPEKLLFTLAENWLAPIHHRDEVVDDDRCSEAVDEEFDSVNAGSVNHFDDQNFLNSFVDVGQRTQIRPEVVVRQLIVVEIAHFEDAVVLHLKLWVDFACPPPRHRFVEGHLLQAKVISLSVKKGLLLWREVRVCPRFALGQLLLDELVQVSFSFLVVLVRRFRFLGDRPRRLRLKCVRLSRRNLAF